MAAQTANTGGGAAALAALLARLEDSPGFPALSESVSAINEITQSDDQNIDDLATVIQKDVGLTSSILRVANSATYRAASGGGISTVSRAVSVLGFATLRDIALTVVLFEQMRNRPGVREIKEAFLRAHLAGTLAREAGRIYLPRRSEEVYTCGLLHSLGQILTLLYLPEEGKRIGELVNAQGLAEAAAAKDVLGMEFGALGQAVAKAWRFPPSLVKSLQPLPEGVVERPEEADDLLWMLAGFGNEVCASLAAGPGEPPGARLGALRQRFSQVMPISGPQLHAVVQKSFDDTQAFAGNLNVNLTQSRFVKQVKTWMEGGADDDPRRPPAAPQAAAAVPAAAGAKPASGGVLDAQQVLSAGINRLSNSIVGDFVLNDVLRLTMETMVKAMDFQRVLMCMRDPAAGYMVARLGLGREADMVARKFRVPLKDAPDVFQLALGNGVDIVIKDIADPKIAGKIPAWYRSTVSARSFILMPLMIKGRAVALLYADKQQPNSIVIPERELSLLKTLRNQAVLAIKQAGGD